ncbi:MAG: patatin-like phospholipase family protein [Azonexus sp.]|nr:patatin-like phospholipase family protein [Azonexus sp.]
MNTSTSITSGGATWSEWLKQHAFGDLFAREGDRKLFDQLTWQPGEADRLAAWQLYTELRTRIATQALPYGRGDEATALKSVYQLFELSRTAICRYPEGRHFASLMVRVLNQRVRPFTAKWHRLSADGGLSNADVRFRFRGELDELRQFLAQFCRLLGVLVEDPEAEFSIGNVSGDEDEKNSESLWKPLAFGISNGISIVNESNRIDSAEKDEIRARRRYYGCTSSNDDADAIGLAISGGGIRSATFALGVVQTLARKGILRDVDYLSTVSGGGYLGAFVSSFLNAPASETSLCPGHLPFGATGQPEAKSVRHLRNHSKYLSEGGFKTFATITGLGAYGIFVSILLLMPLLLIGALTAVLWFGESYRNETYSVLPLGLVTAVELTGLAASVLLLPVVHLFGPSRRWKSNWESVCVWLMVFGVFFLVCEALPAIYHLIRLNIGISSALVGAMLFPFVAGVLGLGLGAKRHTGRFVLGLIGLSGPLFVMAGFFGLCELLVTYFVASSFLHWAVLLLLGLYTVFAVNINFASPHRFYRNRLARTYLTRLLGQNGAGVVDPQPLSQMNCAAKAPYHLINAAVNIPACVNPDLRGRNTDFFLFSKHFCGSPIVGYSPTAEWESVDAHLDLGTAIAISGAAAAPHMGTLNTARYRFLLAMLNVRLSYWLRRPNPKSWWRSILPVGAWYFFRELTGWMNEKTKCLNLSDGGHIENLGIYELLRRRCKFIIAIDGEADPTRSFRGLLTLTQLAQIDLGVSIEPDLSDLRTETNGHGRAHFGLSRIDYPNSEHGLLLYIKSSLTGNESEFLKRYQAENPDFPHQSTLQQLFGETQFEAYRALGEHIADDLFRKDLVGDWENSFRVEGWFKRLAKSLL